MSNIVDLRPINGRKSFYGKAQMINEGDVVKLRSYTTIVAEYNRKSKKLKINGYYSATTKSHLDSFLYTLGLPSMTKKEVVDFN